MSFCAHSPEIVTLGPALSVRPSVTEVTFSFMNSEVQFVTDVPKSEQKRFRRSRVLMGMATCLGWIEQNFEFVTRDC
jgi:hypothetical protein